MVDRAVLNQERPAIMWYQQRFQTKSVALGVAALLAGERLVPPAVSDDWSPPTVATLAVGMVRPFRVTRLKPPPKPRTACSP